MLRWSKIHYFTWNTKFHDSVHKIPPLDYTVNHFDALYTSDFKVQFDIIFSSMPRPTEHYLSLCLTKQIFVSISKMHAACTNKHILFEWILMIRLVLTNYEYLSSEMWFLVNL
jgi:hypothetical protein